ncbi:MAG: hypothetical protein JWM95_4197 [Gemmatimonadetes bacterium]|nr:hypothetical protein [Gemmatimonadota bacterium]
MGTTEIRENLRRIRIPAYAFFIISVAFQLFDMYVGLLPMRAAVAVWRFTVVVNSSLVIGNVILLAVLLHVLIVALDEKKALPYIGTVFAIGAAILLLLIPGFLLDVLQLRGGMATEAHARFVLAAVETLVRLSTQGVICGMFAMGAFRAWRTGKRDGKRVEARDDRRPEDNMLLVRPTGSSAER